MPEQLGVGLIGANPDKGWGTSVHVPALEQVESLNLVAVGTTRMETARQSALKFGATHAFDDAAALIDHPDVDIVAIAVKAPDHYRLAKLALRAGKHVYCEWPLAANSEQAEELASLAADAGVCAMTGLQARVAPAIVRAGQLIAEGYIGRTFAVHMHCALPGGGKRRSREGLYVIDKVNGATTLAIHGGHAIDALQSCVGPLGDLRSVVHNQFPRIEVIETGEELDKDAPEQIMLVGQLQSGASVSIAINGGVVAGGGSVIRVYGEEGTLEIATHDGLNFQMSELSLRGAALPDRTLSDLDVSAFDRSGVPTGFTGRSPYPGVMIPRATIANVATMYRDLAAAILGGTPARADFTDALALHRLLDRIEAGG